MQPEDRYDSLIEFYSDKYGLPWRWIKNQMLAESGANPKAVSPVGAMGLFQFMPATWSEWGNGDPFEPEASTDAACQYMRHLYDRFSEIPDETERWVFAAAAYNAGRANINKMLEFARRADGKPANFARWLNSGGPSGEWQTWAFASQYLPQVTGRHAKETLEYIRKIFGA